MEHLGLPGRLTVHGVPCDMGLFVSWVRIDRDVFLGVQAVFVSFVCFSTVNIFFFCFPKGYVRNNISLTKPQNNLSKKRSSDVEVNVCVCSRGHTNAR